MVLQLPPKLNLEDEARVGQVIVGGVVGVLGERLVLMMYKFGDFKRTTLF